MHPCMYDDHLGLTYNLRERLKNDKKPISGNSASVLRSSSDSSSGTLSDPDKTPSPRAEGRAEGELSKGLEVARNLLAMGMSCSQIIQATGLTEDQLKQLQA